MHQELTAALAESKAPQLASKQTANAQLLPILEAATAMQQQVAVHRGRLIAAELAAPDPDAVRGRLERLHQTLGALDKDIELFMTTGRRIALSMAQYERYGNEIEASFIESELLAAPEE